MTYPQLSQYYRKKAEFIALLGGKCVVCGSTEKLQFHHKDPNKKSFVVTVRYSSLKAYDELRKCELRCVSHHKAMHAAPHGPFKRGCKCVVCVNGKRKYMKEYMRLRRLIGKDTAF